MASYKEKIKLRDQGMTHEQIAETLGISRQAVSQALAKYAPEKFRAFSEKNCIYDGLREWLNKNRVSKAELLRRIGYLPHSATILRLGRCLSGVNEFRKGEIDDILKITGLTYEQAFKVG